MRSRAMRAIATRRGVAALLACASWVVAAPEALAQSRTLAEIADYQGPDRLQKLIDGARKEGSLSLYTSLVAEDMVPALAQDRHATAIASTAFGGTASIGTKLNHDKAIKPS
jgi:hypothetical protein